MEALEKPKQETSPQLFTVKQSALSQMASRFSMDPQVLLSTLKNTVFKGATNEQLAALVVVANEHGLNPFTREIYAFPDKSGGIQAVVGVDGWIRIITGHERFDGVEFSYSDGGCTCRMHVKERKYPVEITEYLDECKRDTDPWRKYPKRMLRHKALIQAGRIAFGFGSLKDEDDVVMSHPASTTIARPIFSTPASLPPIPPPTEAESPQPDAPADNDDGDLGPQPSQPSAPRRGRPPGAKNKTKEPEAAAEPEPEKPKVEASYVAGVRGMLKISGQSEAALMDWLRTTGKVDESISNLEEMSIMTPDTLKWVYAEYQKVLVELKKVKGAA